MTTQDPALPPTILREWVDDSVRRQLETRLQGAFERAAEEIHNHIRRLSGVAETTFASDLSEYRTLHVPEFASLDPVLIYLGQLMAQALAHAAGGGDPGHLQRPLGKPGEASRPEVEGPSTLPELREMSLSAADAAARLGVNPSRIRQRLLARTLYGFKESGSWWVPEFQLEGDRVVPGAERVFPEIRPAASPVAVARWFLTPWEDLVVDEEQEIVVSPRRWLLEGRDPALVVAQAREI